MKFIAISEARSISCPDLKVKYSVGMGMLGCSAVADPENFVGGMIKMLSTKPQKFGCAVTRRVARNSQWSGCFRGLGAKPPALKNFAFFCKINLISELV